MYPYVGMALLMTLVTMQGWRRYAGAGLENKHFLCLQVVFAVIAPRQVVPNLVAGAIAEAGANQAGDMMQVGPTHGHIIVASTSFHD